MLWIWNGNSDRLGYRTGLDSPSRTIGDMILVLRIESGDEARGYTYIYVYIYIYV